MGNSKTVKKNTKNIDSNANSKKVNNLDQLDEFKVVAKVENEVKAMARFNTFHNLHTKTARLILSAVLLIVGGFLMLQQENLPMAIGFFVFAFIFPFILVGIQRIMITSKFSSNIEFKNTSHVFEFTDTEMNTTTKSGKRFAKYNVALVKLQKIYDVGDCYYIYVTKENAFVLKKDKILQGTENELSKILKKQLNDRNIETFKGRMALKKLNKN